jgi:ArsR family transcriptional regulator, cadmium/lead-responsive transcriptional repressor
VLVATVDLEALGRIGTALADETRRQLLVELLDGPGYPAALAEQFGLTKANVSNHLDCLRGCGLVSATPEGRRVRYELADPRFALALAQLVELALPPVDGCAHDRWARP